jgi:predicted ATPase
MTVMASNILARSFHAVLACASFFGMSFTQYLKILAHPVFTGLNFHMPMVVDLSHPLIMLKGENGSGKSTLLHSLHFALRGEQVEGYVYRTEVQGIDPKKVMLFDAEQHNPRHQLQLFEGNPAMQEFLSTASHGQVMLSLFRESFPKLPDGTVLLLDEPEMALSQSNQRRILKMLKELVDQKNFRIVTATHSPALLDDPETYVIDLDRHVNRNVVPEDMGVEGQSTLH